VSKAQSKKGGLDFVKAPLFIVIAAVAFFIMGYFISALSISLWIKVIIFVLVSVLGFALSYVVANLLY